MGISNDFVKKITSNKCPVNGNWGEWNDFGSCSVTCGGGIQQRTRRCNNPSAAFGGLACLLTGSTEKRAKEETESRKCNEQKCKVDGNWGEWSSFTQCSATCGG